MAGYSCMLVVVVLIVCACEKAACIRPAGGAPPYKLAEAKQESGRDTAESRWGAATWKQTDGRYNGAGGATTSYVDMATWKPEIGCSPCEEVYVVRDEGETLQTISEKCHAPFILLDNPHVQDTDDISTGSVLLISSTHLPC